MKILYITRKFPPSIGGMQTQSYEFYSALKKREQVWLIAWEYSQKLLPLFIIIAVIKSTYYILKYNIDIVQVGDLVLSPVGLFLKRVFNKKVLAMAHGKDVVFDNIIYRYAVINLAKKLDAVICVSNSLKQKLVSRGINSKKLLVNYNGINISFCNELLDKNNSIKCLEIKFKIKLKDKKILLAVSRLIKKKGLKGFVQNIFPEIIKNNPNIILLLVGDAESKEARKEKNGIIDFINNHKLKERVIFLGKINDRKILLRQIYSIADVYIMPNQHSSGDFEGFGIVALEASINQVPVVAFDVDGISDAVKNGENGVLVKEGDNKGFTQAVSELFRNEKRRVELGRKARMFVEKNYNWDVVIDRYIKILEKVL